ncbi:MAG: hypothetical protein CMM57_10595 [Rhodospirillaceae bacterium]|nr:hypothetical protein [Rhodospirillaceae bacterium]
MEKLTFLIIFCLPAVCFGQVDGKGIICTRDDGEIIQGFYFDSGTVVQGNSEGKKKSSMFVNTHIDTILQILTKSLGETTVL